MSHANLRWMLNAKRNAVAPPAVDGGDVLEVELWRSYRAQLVAELAEIDRLLEAAARPWLPSGSAP